MNISELPEAARLKLDSIRRLWTETRKTEVFDYLAVEEELESYIQVSSGDLGLMLRSLQMGDHKEYNWQPQLEIAGRAAGLLASLVKTPRSSAQ